MCLDECKELHAQGNRTWRYVELILLFADLDVDERMMSDGETLIMMMAHERMYAQAYVAYMYVSAFWYHMLVHIYAIHIRVCMWACACVCVLFAYDTEKPAVLLC